MAVRDDGCCAAGVAWTVHNETSLKEPVALGVHGQAADSWSPKDTA